MRSVRTGILSTTVGRVARPGITLVEMLVVVALTVLLMSIIAEVFVLASNTMSALRAVSEANQKMRTVEAVIRADLENRSIREVQPPIERRPGSDGILFTADDRLVPLGFDPAQNAGFFTLEENSPADEQGDDTDDVIHFSTRIGQAGGQSVPGLASLYYGNVVINSAPDVAFPPAGDGLAASPEAEIVLFVRRGTLFRRVLLAGVAQPTVNPAGSWYFNYAISARPPVGDGFDDDTDGSIDEPDELATFPPLVNTLGDLTYRSARYGHRPPTGYWAGIAGVTPPIPVGAGLAADCVLDTYFPFPPIDFEPTGRPFHDASDQTQPLDHNHNYPRTTAFSLPVPWWGRPLLTETCDANWDHPSKVGTSTYSVNVFPFGSNPVDPTGFGSTRPSEDALLTNVLSFDVKVWDPDVVVYTEDTNGNGTLDMGEDTNGNGALDQSLGAFVDLGKNIPVGLFPNGLTPAWDTSKSPGPVPSPGSPAGPITYSWPPPRGVARGFGTPWPGDPGTDGVFGTADDVMLPAWAGPNGIDDLGVVDDGLWRRLIHTYDTWCTAYSKPTQVGVTPVGPPYIVPLRGIQIKIRFVDPESRLTREFTIVQELY